MKTTLKLSALILTGMISALSMSCKDHTDIYQGPPTDTPKDFNDFDYTTSNDVTLQINYQNMGGIEAGVDFEVYDQMPVEDKGYTYVKKENVEPIYADRTENDGTFSKKLPLPAYIKTLYIYTHAFYARTLMEAKVENGIAIATDADSDNARNATLESRAKDKYYCVPVKDERWHTYLGNYSSDKGEIQYAYTGDLAYTKRQTTELYKVQSNVINSKKTCPEEYRASTDMYIEEDAEIAVTILGGNTCWNSSMGYYYYKEGQAPNSLAEANVILVFPNTQDGEWSNDRNKAQKWKGVDRGTSVKLMYYPDIANRSDANATSVFPKGYRIGFVLATNGWTGRLSGFTANKSYRAATSKGLSVDNSGKKFNSPRTAIYRYKNEKESINAVIFSFEDHTDDQNFSDVVFTLKTNPIDAITDIPEVTENKTSAKTLKGIYAFEDLWPSKGDYDLNDVLVVSRYEKVYDNSTQNSGMYEESFYLKTLENRANNQNGLGLTLINNVDNADITLTIDGKEAPFTRQDNVILLTDNVKSHMGLDYKLTLKYPNAIKKEEASIKPFIWRKSENGNWEVHIAKEKPTSLVDNSFFGKDDDCSVLDKGIYYVREGNYPFAFFLAGATEHDVERLLDSANESKIIGEVYPLYDSWSTSGGTTNPDWYKK